MEETDYEKLLDQLIRIEGSKLAPYRDAEGSLIIGDEQYAASAGVNGPTVTVLEADLRRTTRELQEQWPALRKLDPVRQRVMIHMAFNMRVSGLLAMDRFVSAVEFRFWEAAAEEILISQWAKGDKRRALVFAEMIRTGRDEMSAFQTRHS
jgi:lysozyme